MQTGELERWNKLSQTAKYVAKLLYGYIQQGTLIVSLNDLRQHFPDSRQLLNAIQELDSRAYGKLTHGQDANPSFTIFAPAIQSLAQIGRLQ